ncbi:MAG: UDP-N-acetylmuramate dehydrogenase [Clostridia bacterium]
MSNINRLSQALRADAGLVILRDEPMSRHTTFKIGGPAELFIAAKTSESAENAIRCTRELGIAPFIMGRGSNLLVEDAGISGVVIALDGGKITRNGNVLCADAGASLAAVARFARDECLTGLEFSYGIPGTVGGAVVMNAGAYGHEMREIVLRSTYLDTQQNICALSADMHNFGYRTSFYKSGDNIILSAEFTLTHGDKSEIQKMMDEIQMRRRSKQPLELPSAGSVFKRPEGHFAGGLIEQCGLKGMTIGGAQVSEKHAGFIVNIGGATCCDVLALIEYIKETVLREVGVELECEVLLAPKK